MTLYDLYVGSTARHAAHTDDTAADYYLSQFPGTRSQRVWGVWDGVTEDVAQYTVDLASDAHAQRVAVALAALTGNDCVLILRMTRDADSPAGGMGNLSAYRVTPEGTTEGNRTLFSRSDDEFAYGVTYAPDREGSHVAFLAWNNGTVSGVA